MPLTIMKSMSMETTLVILNRTRDIYPALILGIFVIGFIIYGVVNAPYDGSPVKVHAMRGPGGRPLPTRRKSANQVKAATAVEDFSPFAKLVFTAFQTGVLLTFCAHGIAVILQVAWYRGDEWWPGQSAVVFIVGCFFVWSMVLISIIDTKPSPTWVHLSSWMAAIPLDLIVLGATLQIYTQPHHEPRVGDQMGGKLRKDITAWEVFEVIVYFIRIVLLFGLVIIFTVFTIAARRSKDSDTQDGEVHQPLLGAENGNAQSQANGHANYGTDADPHSQKEQTDAWAKPTETPNITWYAYLKGFVILLPYLWPTKSRKLQSLALICFLLMLAQRAINIFVPLYMGFIVNALNADKENGIHAPWGLIVMYVLFRWLQGGQGILGNLRTVLWIPVEQYSYRAISTAAFEHVHNLSAEFHTGKRTGELISALNKGSAINSFLEMVTFNVGPMIFDLIVAVVFLMSRFDIYLALVVAIVTFLYIYVTIRLAAWRVDLRRKYTNADREMEAVKNDSLHSWDTVKYFNAEAYEFDRYRGSIKTMQGFEYWVQITLAYMNTVQGTLFMVAVLCACFIEAFQVAQGYQNIGDFTTLLALLSQLQAPLNFFGTFYRAIQNNLINAERMLELFKEQPIVVDRPNAQDLPDCHGDIVFDHVNFGYDKRKQAVQDLNFHCAPGTTTALVGESGGGKTTIMRLIFRYYNPDQGGIRIDGHDVQDITLESLRKYIGVVPQDCNMFNDSILYNLRYANQDASDEEIFDACRAASIHDRILQFPEGYDTKVGERGVKLSGGERQRVAIARTILKNPKITLLDEATAALDTETEEKIQRALKTLAEGRTMLIIAHRLSTVVDADQILVLSGGTVVERGTHAELLEKDGKYASMWRKQSRAQKAAVEAEELRKRAKKALEAAEVDSASVSEEEIERVTKRKPAGGSGHKRVNFSQSSLGKGWSTLNENDGNEEGSSRGGGAGGKPPGHP